MKVKYLKEHNGNKLGYTEDLPYDMANYLIRCNVVEEVKQKTEANKNKK